MEKEVVVLDANTMQSQSICHMLESHRYRAAPLSSLSEFNACTGKSPCRALILNLDNIAVTNKTMRQLKAKHPQVNIIAVSEHQYHPELEESLREYISVCLERPVDEEELMYWLKTVFNNHIQ